MIIAQFNSYIFWIQLWLFFDEHAFQLTYLSSFESLLVTGNLMIKAFVQLKKHLSNDDLEPDRPERWPVHPAPTPALAGSCKHIISTARCVE